MSARNKITVEKDDDYYSSKEKVNTNKCQFLYDYVNTFISRTENAIEKSFFYHIKNTVGCKIDKIDKYSAYLAISYSIRDRLVQFFNVTMNYFVSLKAKQLNFVSSEFLLGRFLQNALFNLQLDETYRKIFKNLKIDACSNLDDIFEEEKEPGPGNSSYSRFAACLFDSLATLNYPAWGYGIYYSKGYYKQKFKQDQVSNPEPEPYERFLKPWFIKRNSIEYEIGFGGDAKDGIWEPAAKIKATANDFLIPGYHTVNTITLRLWSSNNDHSTNKSDDLSNLTERILPSDSDDIKIKEKRFKQEYFLASATIQDILHRLEFEQKASIKDLPKFASIHINNTQPCLMTIELLRILMDEKKMEFEEAFSIVNQVFSFTCHSIISLEFEMWPVSFFKEILPRHLEIIYKVNDCILHNINPALYKPISAFQETKKGEQISLTHIAFFCSHTVNGVSKMQTDMIKNDLFHHFNSIYPEKIINITNGISIRRWLHHCNKKLSDLITRSLNNDNSWPIFNTANEKNIYKFEIDKDDDDNDFEKGNKNTFFNGYAIDPSVTEIKWKRTSELLNNLIYNKEFINEYNQIKYDNRLALKEYIKKVCNIEIDIGFFLFNVQAKEFKVHYLQSLQIFSVIYRYIELKKCYGSHENMQPRAYIFAGKPSPDDIFANQLVHLINNVAEVINKDDKINNYLRVIFLQDYNVSMAEKLIVGADVNPSISTPDCEAAATTNMKFAINGSIIIGSKGGTNIELRDEIGQDIVIEFGPAINELGRKRDETQRIEVHKDTNLAQVINMICDRELCVFGNPDNYSEVTNTINYDDYQLVKASFDDYIEAQNKFDQIFKNRYNEDKNGLHERRITALPHIGQLSSDRAAVEYAEKVWGIKQYPLPIDFLHNNNDEDSD